MAWVVLLVIGYRSVMAIVLNETPSASSTPAPAAPADPGFPAQQASAYALQFGQVYLNAANLEMTYALTSVKQHGTWDVQSIVPSTQAGGQL